MMNVSWRRYPLGDGSGKDREARHEWQGNGVVFIHTAR
ncbi:hypothetical protein SACS_1588 [Parasaccharibacter apium]|uniref:Uncharacterized protein n=1 Tax=Parasaccharibacter apium TaxID=1510841 RepID=A0A7U7J1R0_9PROT|nr:hypothetical protein SACS_1588 [Parasaccharibacter apium]